MKVQKRPKLPMTPRETEVLHLVLNGHKNKAIASELGISLQTTKNHVSHLLKKLNVRSRLELALIVRTNERLTVEKHIHEASPPGKGEVPASPLTPRQTEILYYIGQGLRNKEIADKLGVIEQTIQNHMIFILRRLNVSSRTEAVIAAVERGLIALD